MGCSFFQQIQSKMFFSEKFCLKKPLPLYYSKAKVASLLTVFICLFINRMLELIFVPGNHDYKSFKPQHLLMAYYQCASLYMCH